MIFFQKMEYRGEITNDRKINSKRDDGMDLIDLFEAQVNVVGFVLPHRC
jgi:hypothetical protein